MATEQAINMETEFTNLNFTGWLKERFIHTIGTFAAQPGKSIWGCSKDRSAAKAIYRMLATLVGFILALNEIIKAHRQATFKRMLNAIGVILLVQDTASANYDSQKKMKGLKYNCNQSRGVNIHTCIAVTIQGLVLGLLSQIFYDRQKPKDDTPDSEKSKRPIEEKESFRWLKSFMESINGLPEWIKTLTVCDREGDIYEFMNLIAIMGHLFLIRVMHNRITKDNQRILDAIRKEKCIGKVTIKVPRDTRKNMKEREAVLRICLKKFEIQRPSNLNKNTGLLPFITVWVIRAYEENAPKGVQPIDWFLMTNEPVEGFQAAFKRIEYYTQRWKIERFHYVLKSGCCNIEKRQARSMDTMKILIVMYSIVSVFILNLTYLGRIHPELPCDLIFDETEWKLLYCVANKTDKPPTKPYSIQEAIKYLSWLGGPKRAPSDGPPGVKTISMGLEKLNTLLTYKNWMGGG